MKELIFYCLAAFFPPLLLRTAAAWLPGKAASLRFLLLVYPAGLLILAGAAYLSDPGFFNGWNAFVAGWFAILAVLALAGYGGGSILARLLRKKGKKF